jgi:molybdopterin molybdotransferase
MISPREAIELVLRTAQNGAPEQIPLDRACSLVAARDVTAPEGYPFFPFSARDGYAVRSGDLERASAENPVILPLAGVIRAGSGEQVDLPPGSTLRIMTGAGLPRGADAVVQREEADETAVSACFFRPVVPGSYINPAGAEIKPGDLLWPAGHSLNPAVLGLLATFGMTSAEVIPPPRVTLITSGDELIEPGTARSFGQVYDSVSPMLRVLLGGHGVRDIHPLRCPDDREELFRAVSGGLESSGILITVGGVSVGDYDLMVNVMARAAVETIFWQVAQKPGKPLFFGRRGNTLVFGLPGNPAGALVCCLLYVLPSLLKMMGHARPAPNWHRGKLAEKMENLENRVSFVRGKVTRDEKGEYLLAHCGGQGSYMLSSFAVSDALIELPRGPAILKEGERVRFLPHFWHC